MSDFKFNSKSREQLHSPKSGYSTKESQKLSSEISRREAALKANKKMLA